MGSLPYVSGGASQVPDQTLNILVKGEALAAVNQGRVWASGGSWLPLRILETSPRVLQPLPARSFRRPGLLDWWQSRGGTEEAEEPPLKTEVTMPTAVSAQASGDWRAP